MSGLFIIFVLIRIHEVKRKLSILPVILFIMLNSCLTLAQTKSDPDYTLMRLEQLKKICRKQNLSDNPVNTIKTAKMIEHIADSVNNLDYLLYAYVIIGQSSLFLNDSKSSTQYLNKALDLALSLNDVWGITSSYGNLGILAINKENNYNKGIEYFLEGIKIAEKAQHLKQYAYLACNLAIAYNLRKDTTGLIYAQAAYDYGIKHNDRYMIFSGAFASASLLCLSGKYQEAEKAIITAMNIDDYPNYNVGIYTTYANILRALGKNYEAEEYYRKALRHIDHQEISSIVDSYLSYGEFLIMNRRYRQAADILKTGLDLSLSSKNAVNRYNLYLNLSNAYKHLGNHDEALRYYEAFHHEADSVFSVERERAIKEMQIKYETERHKRMVQQQKTQILLQQRRLHITLFISVILIAGLGTVYILYRHKNKLYLLIVKQYQEALQRESRLRDYLSADKYSSSMSDEKEKQLFSELENLMIEKHLYRKPGLSKKQLSEVLNTNSAYLSQAVNARTGLSITNYINNYRIDESLRLLSDAGNDTQIKAIALDVGFSSLSVFYKTFNEKVGMSPAKYREKVLEISRKNT